MIKRLVAGGKQFFGLHCPGRNLRVFPDDVFLVSYPKSGNTWTRFLIANLIYPEKHPDFANINVLVPDPEGLTKRHLEQSAAAALYQESCILRSPLSEGDSYRARSARRGALGILFRH